MATLSDFWPNADECVGRELSKWQLFSVTSNICSKCGISTLLIAPDSKSDFPSEFRLICISCSQVNRFNDLPMAHQGLLLDAYRLIADEGIDKHSKAVINWVRTIYSNTDTKSGDKVSQIGVNSGDKFVSQVIERAASGNVDAPVPAGFRSIAWIRFYEAEAIIHCYKMKTNFELKRNETDVILRCFYFGDDSDESRKFRANVQVIRINGENQRVIGWIRLEEARAVIDATRFQKDVDFLHTKFGKGGRVQFFPPEMIVAKKYRSMTRLLRKD